jgi:uncharacterized damage-inducible protein DinB
LVEAFRHHTWATKELLRFCRGLSTDQLGTAATGTYGNILDTFNHFVRSHGWYLRGPAGDAPDWALHREEPRDLDRLEEWADDAGSRWERFLAEPFDGERMLLLDEGRYECHAGVVVAQALHHGNAHREQICAILTGLGLQPPDVQVWAYAEATGRGRELDAET